jgi:saccharopine dehydrogenase-like NADP-dependent oxidoreductase
MKIVILGGAGLMASGTVRDLISPQSSGVEKIYVADVDMARAQRLVETLKDPRLTAVELDVSDPARTKSLIEKGDICITAVPTFAGHQMTIFHDCLEMKRHYIDYGGMGVFTVKQKAEHGDWVKAGVVAILGLGSDPGMSNMICKATAEELDTIDRINLYWAAKLVGPENPVLVPPYSMSTIMGEYANPSQQFKDGRLVEMPPQSGNVTLDLPEPFGRMEFMHSQHSEPLTVPFAEGIKEKGIREFTWRLHLPAAEHEVYKALVKVGFGDFEDPIVIKGTSIKPVDFLNAIISRNIEKNATRIPQQETYEIHFAIGEGLKNGKQTKATCMVLGEPDPFFAGYHDAGTSMNASIGAQLLFKNGKKPGVWGPEEYFNTAEYFGEVRKRHFKVSMKIETSWDMG